MQASFKLSRNPKKSFGAKKYNSSYLPLHKPVLYLRQHIVQKLVDSLVRAYQQGEAVLLFPEIGRLRYIALFFYSD